MAIFQPTNILPDLLAGNASGTVFYDPNNVGSVEVSWSVNGNSALTAYQIDFFQNDTASTAAGSTGKVTLSTPFSAVSSDGTVQRFSCSVAGSLFIGAATAAGGYTGKFRITQWWGSGAGQSVVQRSLTVFKVNGISSVSAAYDVPAGYGGIYNFDATFTKPNPDHFDTSLVWTRWQIQLTDGTVVEDTGKVWGATDYSWTCRQLIPGEYYYAQFFAMTSMGELLASNKIAVSFGSATQQTAIRGAVSASCDGNLRAVEVQIKYGDPIQGTAGPGSFDDYVTPEGYVHLPAGGFARWDIPEGLSADQWGFAWVGNRLQNGTVVSITRRDGTVISLVMENGAAFVNPGHISVASISAMVSKVWFFLTTETASGGDWCLYVGTTLNGTYNYTKKVVSALESYSSPARVEFGGGTTTQDFRIVYGAQNALYGCATTGTGLDSSIDGPEIVFPYKSDQTYLENGIALIQYFGSQMQNEGSLFRFTNGHGPEFVANLQLLSFGEIQYVYDYGTAAGNTYEYFIVNMPSETSWPVAHTSEYVKPCWWEWYLIEAEEDGIYGTYKTVQTFPFSMNVSSGNDGNGASPGVYNNFTPYPIVMRDVTNRHSGTLSGLIGSLDGPGEYRDMNSIRDAIRALSASKNTLFLRSRRGDVFKVAIAGEITMTTEDNSPKQQISASIPWVEIGPVDGSIVTGGVNYDLGGGV